MSMYLEKILTYTSPPDGDELIRDIADNGLQDFQLVAIERRINEARQQMGLYMTTQYFYEVRFRKVES